MIRKYTHNDTEAVLQIWLSASIKAHNFVEPSFWESQLENMRNTYLPAAESYVYEMDSEVVGFYSLAGESLAAIFVKTTLQGQGIGKQLIAHAKGQRSALTLSVYKANQASYRFYLRQGFRVVSEQPDEHTGHLEYTMTTEQLC